MQQSSRFAFIDEGETIRRLGIDRDTLLQFVHEKRIRAYPGVGKGSFYRVRDVDALYESLYSATEPQTATTAETAPASGRKVFDPAYKVHVRMQADLKWYDLTDEDLQAWVRELHPDGYLRQRMNLTRVIDRLQRLVELMDEAAANWKAQELPEAATVQPPAQSRERRTLPMADPQSRPAAPQAKPPRRTLPMAGTLEAGQSNDGESGR